LNELESPNGKTIDVQELPP